MKRINREELKNKLLEYVKSKNLISIHYSQIAQILGVGYTFARLLAVELANEKGLKYIRGILYFSDREIEKNYNEFIIETTKQIIKELFELIDKFYIEKIEERFFSPRESIRSMLKSLILTSDNPEDVIDVLTQIYNIAKEQRTEIFIYEKLIYENKNIKIRAITQTDGNVLNINIDKFNFEEKLNDFIEYLHNALARLKNNEMEFKMCFEFIKKSIKEDATHYDKFLAIKAVYPNIIYKYPLRRLKRKIRVLEKAYNLIKENNENALSENELLVALKILTVL